MITESTRPVTVRDLEKLDHRRHRLLWADGAPWGCMVWAPLAFTALVTAFAGLFAGVKGDWRIAWTAAGITAGASYFVVLWIVGGEWLRLRWLAARRESRVNAIPPVRTLAGVASRAWVIVDSNHDEGMPFVLFDVGDGEFLAVDAATALGLKKPEDYRKPPPEEIAGEVTLTLEPGQEWPLWVELRGAPVPLMDLLLEKPRVEMLGSGEPLTHPVRLRLGQLSPEMRERIAE